MSIAKYLKKLKVLSASNQLLIKMGICSPNTECLP